MLTIVGLLNKPDSAGNGGLTTGSPLLPSIDEIKAVSSPHTNAPAPYLIWISNEKLVPKIFLPNRPNFLVWAIANDKRSIAKGYSARI